METAQLKLTQTGTLIHNEDCIIQNAHERGRNNLCVIPLHGINKDLNIFKVRFVAFYWQTNQRKWVLRKCYDFTIMEVGSCKNSHR